MSSSYIANPSASQPPCPAPGPGVLPVSSLPSSTDPFNAAAFFEGLKVPVDFIGYVQKSLALSPPWALNTTAAQAGFSPLIHIGTGTGTVVPTGIGYGGQNFVIKMIGPGGVGTATFQYSTDGGNTFSSTTTTASTFVVGSTGVTVAFSGTFVASDTYQFQQSFTPVLLAKDASGVGRFIIDHNGIDTGGRITRVDEAWRVNTGGLITASPITNYPQWLFTRTGTTYSYQTAMAAGVPCLVITPNANALNDVGWVSQSNTLFTPNAGINLGVTVLEWEAITGGLAATSFDMGFGNQANLSTATNGIFAQVLGAGNWSLVCVSGGSTVTVTGNTPSTSATWTRFKLEVHDKGTPLAVALSATTTGVALLYVNDVLVGVSTNLPNNVAQTISFGSISTIAASGGSLSVSPFSFRSYRSLSTTGNVV
jgi:hypothetical protein